jgi:hypothetical protein
MSPLEQSLALASANLISLSQASKFTPYSIEYLSLLARKGKLKAVKVSRDWLTTEEAVLAYVRQQQLKHQNSLDQLASAMQNLRMKRDKAAEQAEGRAI